MVTSADSATFVLGMMTSKGDMNPTMAAKIVWGTLIAAISVVLIISSGLQGLQTASLISALPFTFIMILMCRALFISLRRDHKEQVKKKEKSIIETATAQIAASKQEEESEGDRG